MDLINHSLRGGGKEEISCARKELLEKKCERNLFFKPTSRLTLGRIMISAKSNKRSADGGLVTTLQSKTAAIRRNRKAGIVGGRRNIIILPAGKVHPRKQFFDRASNGLKNEGEE